MATSQSRVLLLGTDVAGVITGVTDGTSEPVNAAQATQMAFYLKSIGTTSGGTVLIEEADWSGDIDMPYAGTWALIASVAANTFTGSAMAITRPTAPACFAFVRVRISSAITGGGTITAVLRMS